MDKKLIARLFSGILIIAYGGLLLLQSLYSFGPIQLADIWLNSLLIVFGLILMARSIAYNIDSSLWLSIVLVIYGGVGCAVEYSALTYSVIWPSFIAALAIASLAVFAFYKEYNHLKIFVFFGGISTALFLQSFGVISVTMLIPALVILIGIMILVNSVLPHKSNF